MRHPLLLVALAPLFLACGSSGSGENGSPSSGGSGGAAGAGASGGSAGFAGAGTGGGDGGSGGAPFCGFTGVSKGPWSLAVDGSSAKVRWETCTAGPTTVTYTPEAGGDATTVEASVTQTTITSDYKTILPALPHDLPGIWDTYEADLTGLAAGTCYSYVVAGDESRRARFCTSPASGTDFSFLAIGDTNPGLGGSTSNVLAHVLTRPTSFTLHGGDIQYYSSSLETYALWFQLMAPLLSNGAMLPAVGNHESEESDEYQDYFLRFWGGAEKDEVAEHYRFEHGGVWFFAVNTELDFHADSDQGKWLIASLASAQAEPGFRFSIVYQHRPYLTCGDTGDHPDERAGLEPSFLQYGVKLVLQAHMHGYERFELPGLTYVTTGGGGGAIGDVDMNVQRPYCAQRVASGAFYHATVLDLKAGQLTGTAIDDAGAIRDTFTIAVP